MIHIATVHWKNNKWIEVQLSYIKRNLKQPFLIYAFLNDLETEFENEFYFVSREPIEEHAIKLNILAEIIMQKAQNDDIIIFLDGDAFPIKMLDHYLHQKLSTFPLIAVQRNIELGDLQPHPSFCATTVGFWKKMKGDWKMGYLWKDKRGEKVTDVGGNLLDILRQHNSDWFQLLRTQSLSSHPVFYGVYDDMVYHHGAGFRESVSRTDYFSMRLHYRAIRYISFILKAIAGKMDIIWKNSSVSTTNDNPDKVNNEIFTAIFEDRDFFDKKGL